jgi:probable rRNA maturation factor
MRRVVARPESRGVAIDVRRAAGVRAPASGRLREWARVALGARGRGAELAVSIVGLAEARRLNARWRGRDYATNVLSFPAPVADHGILGDVVICADVVRREAREQGKRLDAHWAHLVVHGALHLIGYDHVRDDDARRMEARERRVLRAFGYPDPYRVSAGPVVAPRRARAPRREAA